MFTYVQTQDGSPTVRIGTDPTPQANSEAMHSLKGAFSETVYIYGAVITVARDKGFAARVLSMGLGLGYVEILSAALLIDQPDFGGESFELLPELRDWFTAWVLESGEVPPQFRSIYDQVLARTSEHTGVESSRIRSHLAKALKSGAWRIREALTSATEFSRRFGCICFDAFSSKSTPEVWSEEFLKSFLASAADDACVLSTYACTGALKRSLREAGFALEIRTGFSGKRDSTFAVRSR